MDAGEKVRVVGVRQGLHLIGVAEVPHGYAQVEKRSSAAYYEGSVLRVHDR